MTASPRHWIRTCFLWLSLAVVLTCALGSFGSPLRATSGSAFNAFTSDVALGPNRATAPDKERKQAITAPGSAGGALVPAGLAAPLARPHPRLPVLFRPLVQEPQAAARGPVGARAPPLA